MQLVPGRLAMYQRTVSQYVQMSARAGRGYVLTTSTHLSASPRWWLTHSLLCWHLQPVVRLDFLFQYGPR
jgi:hypothetical protein